MKTMAAPSKEVARDNQVLKMVKTWQANVFYGIINTSHMIESIKRWHGSFCLFCFFYYLRLATNRNESIISSLIEADWSTNTSYIEIIQLNWLFIY